MKNDPEEQTLVVVIEVAIGPKPKRRPKVYRWATVNPSLEDEQELKEAVRKHPACPEIPLEGVITVNLSFYRRIPKSTPKWKLPLMEQGIIRPNNNPDLDNYVKLVLDALNELVWKDDRYIVECNAAKFYSKNPRIKIEFEQINEIRLRSDLKSLQIKKSEE